MSGPPSSVHATELPRIPYMTNNSSHDSSSAPSTMSPQTPSGSLPGVSMIGGQPGLSRSENSAGRLPYPPHPINIPPISELQPRYVPEYDAAAHQEQVRLRGAVSAMQVQSPIGPPAAGQKRAYRQRRKDPSCDACRERKVKCDATETSSCSECTSRNVKCQFTKETNRRMSSIKQVQDLERQLQEARQQLSHVQSQGLTDGPTMIQRDSTSHVRPAKRRRVADVEHGSRIRQNLRTFGKGIFRTDFNNDDLLVLLDMTPVQLELPDRQVAEELLEGCHRSTHMPVTFVDIEFYASHLDEIYRDWSPQSAQPDTIAVLFGLFATGATRKHYKQESERYLKYTLSLIGKETLQTSFNLVRARILAALASASINQSSLAYRLIGQAKRAGQELGLHLPAIADGAREQQALLMWCMLYVQDSFICLQQGLPSSFNEADHTGIMDRANQSLTSDLYNNLFVSLASARVAVVINKALRDPDLNEAMVQQSDTEIDSCISMLTQRYHTLPKDKTNRERIMYLVYMQDLRLLLHRHHIGIANHAALRLTSLGHCWRIAQATLDILDRIQSSATGRENGTSEATQDWRQDVALASTTTACIHIWRCTLFLIARGDYVGAQTCATICAAIGSAQNVNEPCGRYAEFFLDWCRQIVDKKIPLEEDEETLTYLSADMQGNVEQAWAWQGNDSSERKSGAQSYDQDSTPMETGSWNRVLDKLKILVAQAPRALRPILSAQTNQPQLNGSSQQQQTSPTNRISIADII